MSEHTYCDRCGMEISGERHRMGEGAIGPIPWFHHKFDLCGGCFKDWKNWLPRSVNPSVVNVSVDADEVLAGAKEVMELLKKRLEGMR